MSELWPRYMLSDCFQVVCYLVLLARYEFIEHSVRRRFLSSQEKSVCKGRCQEAFDSSMDLVLLSETW